MHEAVDAYNHVKEWAKTEDVPWSLNYGLLGPKIRKEPKGVVLIIRYVMASPNPLTFVVELWTIY